MQLLLDKTKRRNIFNTAFIPYRETLFVLNISYFFFAMPFQLI